MYSASVLDVATVGCFFELQEMSPEPRLNTYPEMDRRVSLHAPQSESTQPVRVMSGPPKTSVRCLVAYRYHIVCCAAVQWEFPRLLLNWARCWTAKATSGRVAVAAYMIDPTAVRYGIFFIRSFSSSLVGPRSFDRTTCGSRGVVTGCASKRSSRLVMLSMYAP